MCVCVCVCTCLLFVFVQDCDTSGSVLRAGQLLQHLEEDAACCDRECSLLRHVSNHLRHPLHLPGHSQADHSFVSALCT